MSACLPKKKNPRSNTASNKSSTDSLQSRKSRHPPTQSRSNDGFKLKTAVVLAPSISKNPQMWFDYYDKDGNNGLSRQELTDALFELNDIKDPASRQTFLQNIKKLWEEYDTDYIGQIEKREFLKKGGLAERVMVFEKMKMQKKIQIKIFINEGMKPNDTVKVVSPRNNLPMVCSIPEENEWRTLDGKSFFFLVTV